MCVLFSRASSARRRQVHTHTYICEQQTHVFSNACFSCIERSHVWCEFVSVFSLYNSVRVVQPKQAYVYVSVCRKQHEYTPEQTQPSHNTHTQTHAQITATTLLSISNNSSTHTNTTQIRQINNNYIMQINTGARRRRTLMQMQIARAHTRRKTGSPLSMCALYFGTCFVNAADTKKRNILYFH